MPYRREGRIALRCIACFALLLPWLNPFAPGPTPAAFPWLLSLFCAAFVLAFAFRLRVQDVMFVWVIAASASCIIALCQYFTVAQYLTSWMNAAYPGEAYANLRQRNQFASLTNIGLLALLWFVSTGRPGSWYRAMPFVVLLAAGNAASASRTGLFQLLMVAALVFFWRGSAYRGKLSLCVLAGVVYAASALSFPPLLKWATGIDVLSAFARMNAPVDCSSRSVLWSNVIELIREKPWFGWGWGELDYAHYMHLYPGARFCDILDNAHNLPLHIAVELGIPAALLSTGLVCWLIWRLKPWCEKDVTRQTAWGVIAVVALHSLLEYPLWYGPFQLSVIACIVLLWRSTTGSAEIAASTVVRSGGFPPDGAVGRWQAIRLVGAILLIAISGYGMWDYRRVSQVYLAPQERAAAYRDDTLAKARNSWLFRSQAQFAELSLTPLVPGNAQWVYDTATSLLHYSPEPRVIEKTIESATMLGRDAEALAYLARYKAAFPAEAARWAQGNAAVLKALSTPGA